VKRLLAEEKAGGALGPGAGVAGLGALGALGEAAVGGNGRKGPAGGAAETKSRKGKGAGAAAQAQAQAQATAQAHTTRPEEWKARWQGHGSALLQQRQGAGKRGQGDKEESLAAVLDK